MTRILSVIPCHGRESMRETTQTSSRFGPGRGRWLATQIRQTDTGVASSAVRGEGVLFVPSQGCLPI